MNFKRLPWKARRHITNFLRFLTVYFIVDIFVDTAQKFQVWNHFALIEAGLIVILFLITAWFSWRFYTGMFRDFDFYDED